MFKTAEKVQGLGIVLSVLHYLVCNIFFAVFYPPLLKLNVNYHCYSARISSRDQIFFFLMKCLILGKKKTLLEVLK